MAWTRGRRLGLDVGLARIGVAQCDPDGILATPVETIAVADGPDSDTPWQAEMRRVLDIAEEGMAVGIVIGVPTNLKGTDTASTRMARDFGTKLDSVLPDGIQLHYADERLTTVQASQALRQAGRKSRSQRSVIDQQAAVMILQNWVDSQRAER